MCVNDEVFSEAAIKGNLESLKELEREIKSHQKQQLPKFDETKPMAKDQPSIFRPTSMRINHENSDTFENVGISNSESDSAAAFIPEIEAVPGYGNSDSEQQIKIYSARENDFAADGNEQLPNAVGFANDLIILTEYIKENKEKAILYFLLSVTTGLLLLLLGCIFQQCRKSKEPKTRQIDSNRRMQTAKSPELNSLIGGSSNTSPIFAVPKKLSYFCVTMFFDSDTHSRMGLDMGDGHYMRFSQVTPPRIPQSMHYYT
uniref:Uncharacterized protein n=1 Tax=Panagrolaimus davidi TaxID=227884 RepID=A0A914QS47_9BILA